MFRIKICGITTIDDARIAANVGADAIGLNFYRKSPRSVDVERAMAIAAALPASVLKVGVFVNAPSDEVCATFDRVGLDLIQLHGDEPPEFIEQLGDRPVMRAFRLGSDGLASAEVYLKACRQRGSAPKLVLIDAHQAGTYGGTGATADWNLLNRERQCLGGLPLILAGGLNPGNVAAAIQAVRPAGVDTASGVESSPGRKDPALVRAFVATAKAALIVTSR